MRWCARMCNRGSFEARDLDEGALQFTQDFGYDPEHPEDQRAFIDARSPFFSNREGDTDNTAALNVDDDEDNLRARQQLHRVLHEPDAGRHVEQPHEGLFLDSYGRTLKLLPQITGDEVIPGSRDLSLRQTT